MLRISAFLMVAMTGCGGGGGHERGPEEVAAEYEGAIQSADVAHGEEVYNNICMSCHGGGAPELPGIAWEPGRMRQQVREGGSRMPAINETRVSADDLEALLAFMTTNGAVTGELPAPEEPAVGEPPAEEDAPAEDI